MTPVVVAEPSSPNPCTAGHVAPTARSVEGSGGHSQTEAPEGLNRRGRGPPAGAARPGSRPRWTPTVRGISPSTSKLQAGEQANGAWLVTPASYGLPLGLPYGLSWRQAR